MSGPIERQAANTAFMTTRVNDISETVIAPSAGRTGYLAEPGNVGDLRDGIVQLLNTEPLGTL